MFFENFNDLFKLIKILFFCVLKFLAWGWGLSVNHFFNWIETEFKKKSKYKKSKMKTSINHKNNGKLLIIFANKKDLETDFKKQKH